MNIFSRSINISGVIICGKFSGNSVQTNNNLVILHSSKYAVQGRKKLEILSRTFVFPFFKKKIRFLFLKLQRPKTRGVVTSCQYFDISFSEPIHVKVKIIEF